MAKIIEFPSDFDVERYLKLLEEIKQKPLPDPVKNCLRIRIPEIEKKWKDIRPEVALENIPISKEENVIKAVRKLLIYIREKDWELIRYMMGLQVRICELEYKLSLKTFNSPPDN